MPRKPREAINPSVDYQGNWYRPSDISLKPLGELPKKKKGAM
jgi:hypothetical protein